MKISLRDIILVNEALSIPLSIVLLTVLFSGYTLVYPRRISMLTMGLINSGVAYRLHSDLVLRMSLSTLLAIHLYTGFIVLVEKYVRHNLLRDLVVLLLTLFIAYIFGSIILLDILSLL